uniref:Endonuclease/exonuclease/phosphatase domain-containing protein n=1 Tax=Octopus bimaculoides TaxID=37653 RepID=A0A0L8GVI4_OCTBM
MEISINSTIGGVRLLLSPHTLKSRNTIERITSRLIIVNFNGNPSTTVTCCYRPTNVSDEQEVINFYNDISSLVRYRPQHNILIIEDMNALYIQS